MILKYLNSKGLIKPPSFLIDNTQYLVQMGSEAYGVSSDSSDIDVYGWCIPPKDVIFPHLRGEIIGFGRQIQRFEQFQQHHVIDMDSSKEYDFTIYNIVKYFQLVMENNPNMIDSLFVPVRCILHMSEIGNIVREHRKLFLHKGAWFKFKGYAYSQLHKMQTKTPQGKRVETVEQYGYDVKFAYHLVRLLNEIEMILIEGDLDLERNREQLKSIRRGEWTEEQIVSYFNKKESELESLYTSSTLPYKPDEDAIKELLLNCLEAHYGSLDNAVSKPDQYMRLKEDIRQIAQKYGI